MNVTFKPVRLCIYLGRMGKSKKTTQLVKGASSPKEEGPITLTQTGLIRLPILAKPGAKVSAVTGIESDGVAVQIGARPVDGEANAELIAFISSVLGFKKNEISLDKGSKSRQKVILISSPQASVAGILEKLKSAVGQ